MLALVAGTGALPAAVARAVAGRAEPFVVCQMHGFEVENLPDIPKIHFRIETLGTLLLALSAEGVDQVCFAGAVTRPDIDPAAIDVATAPLVPKIQAAISSGDDGALRAVIALFEDAGFRVVAAQELAPELLCSARLLAGPPVDEKTHLDLAVAMAAHAEMSVGDIGQAVVAAGGQVIAREGRSGTDAMLLSLIPVAPPDVMQGDPFIASVEFISDAVASLTDWITGHDGPKAQAAPALGGLLYKAPKIGQDRRADLPVIGPRTLMLAAEAGLSTIVIEAMGVMVIDKPQVCAIAEAMDIRLWVREAGA